MVVADEHVLDGDGNPSEVILLVFVMHLEFAAESLLGHLVELHDTHLSRTLRIGFSLSTCGLQEHADNGILPISFTESLFLAFPLGSKEGEHSFVQGPLFKLIPMFFGRESLKH